MKVIVTGAAGFIGFHLCNSLLKKGHKVLGIDNINSYYDKNLKQNRLKLIQNKDEYKNFSFLKGELQNELFLKDIFKDDLFSSITSIRASEDMFMLFTDWERFSRVFLRLFCVS